MSAAQIIIQSQYDGQLVDNCLTMVGQGDFVPPTDLAEMASVAANKWGQFMVPLLVPSYQLTGATATDIPNGVSASYTHVVNGSLTSQGMPAFVCAKVGISTATPKVRGRTGISGLPSNVVGTNTNFLNPANQAEFDTAWHNVVNALETALNAGGFVLGVYSRTHNKAPRVPPLEVPATGSSVLGKLGTRRSRLN